MTVTVITPQTDYYSCYIDNTHLPWETMHDATDGIRDGLGVRIRTYKYLDDLWSEITRGILAFNTGFYLPDDCTVNSATLSLWGVDVYDDLGISPMLNIYGCTDDTKYGSYGSCGTLAYSTPMADSSWQVGAWNEFVLVGEGVTSISKTGATLYSVREATYDAPDNEPDPTANGVSGFRYLGARLSVNWDAASYSTTAAPGTTTAPPPTTTNVPTTTDIVAGEWNGVPWLDLSHWNGIAIGNIAEVNGVDLS